MALTHCLSGPAAAGLAVGHAGPAEILAARLVAKASLEAAAGRAALAGGGRWRDLQDAEEQETHGGGRTENDGRLAAREIGGLLEQVVHRLVPDARGEFVDLVGRHAHEAGELRGILPEVV